MKIEIKVYTDYPNEVNNVLIEQATCGSFESAGEQLGKMELRFQDRVAMLDPRDLENEPSDEEKGRIEIESHVHPR